MLAAVSRATKAAQGVLGRTRDAAAAANEAADGLIRTQEAALSQFQETFAADIAQEQVHFNLSVLHTTGPNIWSRKALNTSMQ